MPRKKRSPARNPSSTSERSGRRSAPPNQPSAALLNAYEPPLLVALFLAPLVGGMFDARPSAGGGLAWLADFPLLASLGRYPSQLWLGLIAALVWLTFVLRFVSRRSRGEPLPLTPALGWLSAFTLLVAASILTSVYRGASLVNAASYGTWLGAAFLAADIGRRPGGAERLLGALLAGTTVAAAIGLRQTLDNGFHGNWQWRVFGTFGEPNLFAACLVPALPLAVAFFLRASRAWILLTAASALMVLAELMFTGSRGAIYSLPVVLVVFTGAAAAIGSLRGRTAWTRFAALLGVLIVVAVVCSASLKVRSLTVARTDRATQLGLCPPQVMGGTSGSNAFRLLTWKATWRMVKARPLLGFGAGTFPHAFPRYALAGYTRAAHDSYLQYAAEIGLPALLCWLAALASCVWTLLRRVTSSESPAGAGTRVPGSGRRDSQLGTRNSELGTRNSEPPTRNPERPTPPWWLPAVLAAIVASALHNLTDTSWYVPGTALAFWTLLGLAASLRAPQLADAPAVTARPRLAWILPALACCGILGANGWATWLDQQALDALVPGDPYTARDDLRSAVSLAPWDADLHADLAVPLAETGDRLGAIGELQAAVRRAPTSAAFQFRLGRAWEAMGDSRHTIAAFESATQWTPNGTQGWLALAEARERAGDAAGALADYRRITELEQGPTGRIRAIGEYGDYRFTLAHKKLGDAARAAGDLATTRREYLAAACGYASTWGAIRTLSGVGRVGDLPDPDRARQMRADEVALWNWLAGDYARHGDAARSRAARELASDAAKPR